MKRQLLYITLLICFTGLISSCSKYLDQVPNDRITIEEVFKKKAPSEQYLANVYSYVDDESDQWNSFPWFGNADEGDVTWSKYATYDLNIGNMSAGNVLFDKWGYYYRGIRSATYFMAHINENVEIRSLNGQQLIDQYQAEARCLRAYYYFLLMRQFGPVVLVGDKPTEPDAPASAMQLPRSSFDECVNYVSNELDAVAAVLPLVPVSNGQPSDLEGGRMTKGIALAIKARLLLYAASPLYNGNTEMAGFKDLEGKNLISQTFDKEKWKRAADAAKAVIDMRQYTLYKDPGGDVKKSLQGIFSQGWNSEQIFVRKSNNLPTWDVHCMPRQAGGWCGLAPTQEQVDAYFMKDGKSILESDLYSESGFTTENGVKVFNMYQNREPRFYTDITYNNCMYQGGNMQSTVPINFFISGPNGKNGHPTDWSKTGYLVRKNVSPQTNDGSGGNGRRQNRPIILFRLGEIYLDYVEALNEYEPGNSDILLYLNAIRERAGIPMYGAGANALPIPVSQIEVRKKIRDERRVELAFECHRWFDIRRWKIAASVMGNVHGMDINKDNDDFYKRSIAAIHLFSSANYWFPISQYEMDRGRIIVQNPGW
ncbi:RagB/SusD family nutrient uptake outer membrane protein [Chitinophaga silvatica]|uniref:RagB/SusD family nutrient uptake outer membrane protein n=1 Tax=Chitinophaga silvatica TaxID=2282649 RepID=A0A3E1YG19_9BACT|nr:RagB/SusD family nutrient uptake outer membrane protein [Chitinophaga silvatica]RFS26312.1 RagB/SusD family nutrient uptake outer membrane protein [Chitinophaga silvatica]